MDNLRNSFKISKLRWKSALSAFLLLLSILFLISFGLNKRIEIVEKISVLTKFKEKEEKKEKILEKNLNIAPLNIQESPKKLEKLEIDTSSIIPESTEIDYAFEKGISASLGEGLVDFQNEKLEIFEVVDLDKIPKKLKNARIQYPSQMLKKDIEGEVRLLVLIDEEGNLSLEKTLFATNQYFEKAAISALKEFKYEAPMKMGKKVKARFILPIPFNIERIK